ncbi:tail fiber domain-containing protein, partial [Pseudomonas syringae]|nr:tail fiber domain-containing protein [Pseudomonas syringae]MBM1218558.1 tail fiber domain-containing protein [Pseudomonas syringae]
MPWYKTGTVSVTQNSNAVIGSGTAFIANSRVGDGFRGPDGGWYEVTNIASDTAMSISPNYQGATNGAGGYALAPLQGYVKESADRLRALVLQYGEKLAALGTTGNYDILPVAKGGTGATDSASALTSLGMKGGAYDAL